MSMGGRGRAATIALCAMVLALPNRIAAQDVACDPGEPEVRALEFEGNRTVTDDELEVRVATTATSWARRRGLPFGTRRCLDRSELPLDVLRLREFYERRGFRRAVVDTSVTPAGDDAVRVTFRIEEGPPTILRSYAVTGLDGIADAANIMNATLVRAGRPFDIDQLAADKDTIVRRLRNLGYYRALVAHDYRSDSLYAVASLRVVPGARARFGEPQISVDPVEGRGQQIPNDVVERLLGIAPGTFYSDRVLVDAQRSLFSLGTYRHIDVAPLPDSLQPRGDTIVVLGVRLTEDYMRQLDSEFGWATLDCGRVRMQYSDRNWLRSARRLEVTGYASKIGYGDPLANSTTKGICDFGGNSPLADDSVFSGVLHYHLGASIRQPRLLGFRWTPTLSLYSERRGEYTAYLRTTHFGADLSATRDVGFRMPFRLAYTMEYGRTDAPIAAQCALFNRCNPLEETPLDTTSTLGVVSASVAKIRTDNPISPTSGYLWRAEARTSAATVLGTTPSLFFNKGTGDVALYTPMGRSTVLAFRARAGAVVGHKTSGSTVGFVPPQERLYAGGATSVRGFQQNELGALVYITAAVRRDTVHAIDTTVVSVAGTDTTFRMTARPGFFGFDRTVPLGGNSLVVLNLDLRIRDPFLFPDRLQYTVFLDAGDVGTQAAGQTGSGLGPLKLTPGLGVRLLTLIGPVQVNVGYNGYEREVGPLYLNPNVSTLSCVSPNNQWDLRREEPNVSTRLVPRDPRSLPPCPNVAPPERNRFLQKLTFTFSIGPDF